MDDLNTDSTLTENSTTELSHESKNKGADRLLLIIFIMIFCLITCPLMNIGLTNLSDHAIEQYSIDYGIAKEVLTAYMKYMEVEDIESAYDMYSDSGKKELSLSDLEVEVHGSNHRLYQNVDSIIPLGSFSSKPFHLFPTDQKEMVLDASGFVVYKDESIKKFTASLEKNAGKWEMAQFAIGVDDTSESN